MIQDESSLGQNSFINKNPLGNFVPFDEENIWLSAELPPFNFLWVQREGINPVGLKSSFDIFVLNDMLINSLSVFVFHSFQTYQSTTSHSPMLKLCMASRQFG